MELFFRFLNFKISLCVEKHIIKHPVRGTAGCLAMKGVGRRADRN